MVSPASFFVFQMADFLLISKLVQSTSLSQKIVVDGKRESCLFMAKLTESEFIPQNKKYDLISALSTF